MYEIYAFVISFEFFSFVDQLEVCNESRLFFTALFSVLTVVFLTLNSLSIYYFLRRTKIFRMKIFISVVGVFSIFRRIIPLDKKYSIQ